MLHHKITTLQRVLRKKGVWGTVVAITVITGFVATASTGQAGLLQNILERLGYPAVEQSQTTNQETLLYKPAFDYEQAIITAVEKTTPVVVSIIVSKDLPVIENCPTDPFSNLPPEIRQFFGFDTDFEFSQPCARGTEKQEVGGGSGFIVSQDGYIVTNKHVVVDAAAEYTVLTNEGKKYDAIVLARHPSLDIAILKITANGLSQAQLGNSDGVMMGQSAIAIGNALGEFRNTVSVGVISGLARNITAADGGGQVEAIENVLQTDAAINPGNSGGPLLNLRGEVIGINVATVSGAQSIGFAIPINAAKQSIDSVRTTGAIGVPYLGVRHMSLTPELAKTYKLPVEQGAFIKGTEDDFAVQPGSAADRAGLKEGDVILEIDGTPVDNEHSLVYLISQKKVGQTVELKISRGGREMRVDAILQKRES